MDAKSATMPPDSDRAERIRLIVQAIRRSAAEAGVTVDEAKLTRRIAEHTDPVPIETSRRR